jgi:hypothetical protein
MGKENTGNKQSIMKVIVTNGRKEKSLQNVKVILLRTMEIIHVIQEIRQNKIACKQAMLA